MLVSRTLQSTETRMRRALSGLLVVAMISAVGGSLWAVDRPVEKAAQAALISNETPEAPSVVAATEAFPPMVLDGDSSGPSDAAWSWFNVGLSNQLKQATGFTPIVLDAYARAAQNQSSPALVNLGYMHETGQGVPKDIVKAISYYRQAAELGNPVALYNLGRSYYTGTNGLPLDWSAARRYLDTASGEGLVAAQHLLGQLNLDQNQASNAVVWFARAAEHGFVPSMCSLASLYHYGRGAPVDLSRAIQWYRRAADSDFVPAQYQLGVIYDSGSSVQNPVMAETYLRKAAEHGHRESQYLLGQYFYRGRVMKSDMAEAYRWWTLSEMSGLEVASAARRQLMRIIAPVDLDRGRALVTAFKPVASTFRDDGVAAIQANARMTDELPSAFGAGFIVSGAGHVLTSARHVPNSSRNITVAIVGGKLRATPVKVDTALGLAIVQIQGGARSFHSLAVQTNRSSIRPGSWVFCMHMEPGSSSRDTLQPSAHRSRVVRNSGLKADPRYFTLSDRMPLSTVGAPVLDVAGQILGIVTDPAPKAYPNSGAVALSARYINDFLRNSGITAEPGMQVEERGEAAPSTPMVANNALVHVTTYSSLLP